MSNLAIPTIADLVAESEQSFKDNALMVILNTEPHKAWIEEHPFVSVKKWVGKELKDVKLPYLPISRIEYLLSRIFTKWWVEVKSVQQIANSVVVTVRLYVVDPVSGETRWNDGCGASPMQTDKGAGAIEWDKIKASAVMMAVPSAESYAFKDAAEKFGKIFGKDLGRKDVIDYTTLLKSQDEPATKEELVSLFNTVQDLEKTTGKVFMTTQDEADYQRVIDGNEVKTYNTIRKMLNSKIQEATK